MKNFKKYSLSIAMVAFLFLSCEDEATPENSTEIIDQVSMVEIAGLQVERKISFQINKTADYRENREIIGVEIDGNKLANIGNDRWYMDIKNTNSNENQIFARMELPSIGDVECDTDVSRISIPGFNLGGGITIDPLCITTTTTTCYSAYTNQDGVLVGGITVSTSSTSQDGPCPGF